jgi:hypothetical protein
MVRSEELAIIHELLDTVPFTPDPHQHLHNVKWLHPWSIWISSYKGLKDSLHALADLLLGLLVLDVQKWHHECPLYLVASNLKLNVL